MTGAILLTAATHWEAEPLAKRLGLRSEDGRRYAGSLGGRSVVLLKTGMGREKTLAALASEPPPAFIFSTGLAGALQEDLKTGDLIADLRGCDSELVEKAKNLAESMKIQLFFGKIVASDRVVASPEAKSALGRSHRAGAVDMESAAVREWAASHGATAMAVRAILDGLHDRLPTDLPASEGWRDLAVYAARHWTGLPRLVRLGFKQRRAMRRLTAFLEDFLARL